MLVEVGAVAAVEQRITELTETAMAALDRARIDPLARDELTGLAVAATRRDR
jgi:geranylgeranyl diphosphate synthase type I